MGKKWDKLSRNLIEPQSEADIKRKAEYGNSFQGRRSNLPDIRSYARVAREATEWHMGWLTEAFRVLVPGGMAKVFSATRTFHWLAWAMEQVGFMELKIEAWCYSTGFPKSLNVSKAIDKTGGKHGAGLRAFCNYTNECRTSLGLSNRQIDEALDLKSGGSSANHWTTHPTQPRFPRQHLYVLLKTLLGMDDRFDEHIAEAEREIVGAKSGFKAGSGVAYGKSGGWSSSMVPITVPATKEARRFEGYGTALKPAWEPFLVGRKP